MALRASELVGLQVKDVYDGEMVKNYVNIQAETAKYKKERKSSMLNFNDASISELIVELQARGIDMTSPKKIVAGAEGLRRYGTASKVIALPRRDQKADTK
jgi:hypothetical protein